MGFSVECRISEIYADAEARRVLEKYFPKLTRTPSFQMTFGMSFRTLSRFSQWGLSPEQLAAADEELRAIR